MGPSKTTARIVGALFIAATVTGALGLLVFIQPVLDDSDYLVQISVNENRVLIGVLLEFLSAVAVAGIGVLVVRFLQHLESGVLA